MICKGCQIPKPSIYEPHGIVSNDGTMRPIICVHIVRLQSTQMVWRRGSGINETPNSPSWIHKKRNPILDYVNTSTCAVAREPAQRTVSGALSRKEIAITTSPCWRRKFSNVWRVRFGDSIDVSMDFLKLRFRGWGAKGKVSKRGCFVDLLLLSFDEIILPTKSKRIHSWRWQQLEPSSKEY
jgi:hypothetical protein